MGFGVKMMILGAAIACSGVVLFRNSTLFKVPPVPKMEETWWTNRSEDTKIRPFEIRISDDVINDLKTRLMKTRYSSESMEGVKHTYGINSQLTKKINDFWIENYNWKEREALLNKYPQFKTNIQGLDIHFLHVKPKKTQLKVIPLLLIHGWPGSVKEFYGMIPSLTTPQQGRKFVFEVIAPSLPGYGFSDPAIRPGLGPAEIAVVLKNLMLRLNLKKFAVQGGDWGSIISSNMAILFPENVVAMHSNLCYDNTPTSTLKKLFYSVKPSLIVEKKYEHLVYPMTNIITFLLEEGGYFHLQATKPDTIGTALNDSPAGLAAYIIEKFITWTNPNCKHVESGCLTQKYKMEDLLDNVMIYWISNSITSSIRIYAEFSSRRERSLNLEAIPVSVPTGCSRFIHDILYTPTALLENRYPQLMHVTDHEGGHFAAMELPEVLSKDIYDFTEKVLRLNESV